LIGGISLCGEITAAVPAVFSRTGRRVHGGGGVCRCNSESIVGGEQSLQFVLIGFFLVHLFEHTIAPHFHFGEETHSEEVSHHHARNTVLLGLTIHTFFDGVAIAAGFLVSVWLGAMIFVAVFLHKLPEGFTVASVVLASGQGRRNAILAAGLLGAATLLGVLLTSVLQSQLKYALPISGGVTVYVAATDLLPEVNREPNWRMAMLVFVESPPC
jgi:ZIP family zinc transporter/zinc and cadmium transporter